MDPSADEVKCLRSAGTVDKTQGKVSLKMKFPKGKDFLFTIFDDTDVATLDYIRPIYNFLHALGIHTTKSVWPLKNTVECNDMGAHTLEHPGYADYVRELMGMGFEIGYHGATMHDAERAETQRAFELFRDVVGYYPRVYANHALNRDNLYWGLDRFELGIFRSLYARMAREKTGYYQGNVEGSAYFWGDLCQEHVEYVRGFTYSEINLLNISSHILYRSRRTPWVNNWFISTDSDNVEEFNRLLRPENQRKLERQQGVCILSTHFGKGFLRDGRLHPRTQELLEMLSERNGWFVPVSTALDFLRSSGKVKTLTKLDSFRLEFMWFLHSFRRKHESLSYEKTEVPYLVDG
jgi:hypothetical protein